jgi:hypothetical protein
MKKVLPTLFGILAIGGFVYFKHFNKSFFQSPVEKYNSFISLSNMCNGTGDPDRALTNYSKNYAHLLTAEQMTGSTQALEAQLARVEQVSDKTGTKEACVALGKFCIDIQKNQFMQIIKNGQGKTPDEIKQIADSIMQPTFENYDRLYEAFDKKINAFAKDNNIKETIIDGRAKY